MTRDVSSIHHALRSRQRQSWSERTFVQSEEAEAALCTDRSSFILRHDISRLIPMKIRKRITHPGDNAQIDGFEELFIHLNSHRDVEQLRRLITAYFRHSPTLCGHLSQSSPPPPAMQSTTTITMYSTIEPPNAATTLQIAGDMVQVDHSSDSIKTNETAPVPEESPSDLSDSSNFSRSATETRRNTIASTKIVLHVAAAGFAAAPIPGLDRIPNILLTLIQTYETISGNNEKLGELCNSIGLINKVVLRPLQCLDGDMPREIEDLINGLRSDLTSQLEAVQNETPCTKGSLPSAIMSLINATEASVTKCTTLFNAAASTATLREIVRRRIHDALSTLPVADAKFISVRKEQCFETTRVGIQGSIMQLLSRHSSRFVWLQGSPGTGKTAVAKSVADSLARDKRLAASFFWDKTGGRANAHSIELVPSTLTSQLATFSLDYETLLVNRLLDRTHRDVLQQPLAKQMDSLIIQLMSSISHVFPPAERGPVVVLDGLDECGTLERLMGLVLLLDKLPPAFVILVSSRPEPEIRAVFKPSTGIPCVSTDGIDTCDTNHTIVLMVKRGLAAIRQPHDSEWAPSNDDLYAFARTCRQLPVLAETRVREVRILASSGHTLQDAFCIVKEGAALSKDLNDDYLCILRRAYRQGGVAHSASLFSTTTRQTSVSNIGSSISPYVIHTYRQVVGMVIAAKEPLSVQTMSKILAIPEEKIRATLDPIGAIVNVPSSRHSPIYFYHASAKEYLTGPPYGDENDRDFFFSDMKGTFLALPLLKTLTCRGDSDPSAADHQSAIAVADWRDNPLDDTGPDVAYAARYWSSHLDLSSASEELWGELVLFLTTKLLLWMGLCGRVLSRRVLEIVLPQIKFFVGNNPDLPGLVEDAIQICDDSRWGNDLDQIYCSILPFLPRSSLIRKYYDKPSNPIRVLQVDKLYVPPNAPTIPIACATLSGDGRQVALGFRDGGIEVIDIEHGVRISRFADRPVKAPVWLLFLDDGQLATENTDGDGYILDTFTLHQRQFASRLGGTGVITSLSHDNSMIVRVAWLSGKEWCESVNLLHVSGTITALAAPRPTPASYKCHISLPFRRSVGFSPDGQYVAAFDVQHAFVWSSTSLQLVAQYPTGDPSVWFLNTNHSPVMPPFLPAFESSQHISSSCVLFTLESLAAPDLGSYGRWCSKLALGYPPSPSTRIASCAIETIPHLGSQGSIWHRCRKIMTIPNGYRTPHSFSIKLPRLSFYRDRLSSEDTLTDAVLPTSKDGTRFLICDKAGLPVVIDISG